MLRIIFVAMIEKSMTIGIIILLLKLISPIVNEKFAAKWKYYTWLIISLHLIIPLQLFSISIIPKPIEIEIPNIQTSTVEDTNFNKNNNWSDEGILNEINLDKKAVMTIDIFIVLWLSGAIIFLLYQIHIYWFQRKELFRWRRPLTSVRVKEGIEKNHNNMCHKKQINVFLSDKAPSPMIIGFFN